ncbi:MAG: cyclic nucleotide-binding domain-containing protein [Syntrophobacteraceae bacterium]
MFELLNALKGVVLFQDLTEQDLTEIAQRITKRTYKLGEFLYRSGEPRAELAIIQAGEVEILQGVGEVQKVVARLGEGNFVGEGAMLSDEPHSSSCRAVIGTNVLVLERRAIDEIFMRSPDATRKILSQVAHIMTYRLTYSSYGPLGTDCAGAPGREAASGTRSTGGTARAGGCLLRHSNPPGCGKL